MIFPGSCLGCGEELVQGPPLQAELKADSSAVAPRSPACFDSAWGFMRWQHDHWCPGCWSRLSSGPLTSCEKCGAFLLKPNPLADRCGLCHGQDLRFDQAIAVGNYQGLLQELVIRMKGQHDEALAYQLGRLLGYELLVRGWSDFDKIISVPAHWWRKLKRGFLAADVLSESISRLTGIPKCNQTLRSIRTTRKQGTLSTQGRIANVRNAFQIYPHADIKDKQILIIDDVMTSGATTSELARILKRHGAAKVCVAVVARGAKVS